MPGLGERKEREREKTRSTIDIDIEIHIYQSMGTKGQIHKFNGEQNLLRLSL